MDRVFHFDWDEYVAVYATWAEALTPPPIQAHFLIR
jgi:hypothetical protein